MGFLAPIGAALAGIGSAVTAGAATGTAATLIGGATAASAGLAAGTTLASLASGPPKLPAVAAAPPSIPAPTPIVPTGTQGTNKSLASLSPGLALGGTVTTLGGSPSGGQKTLLGQ